jgi:hypothetical protein
VRDLADEIREADPGVTVTISEIRGDPGASFSEHMAWSLWHAPYHGSYFTVTDRQVDALSDAQKRLVVHGENGEMLLPCPTYQTVLRNYVPRGRRLEEHVLVARR